MTINISTKPKVPAAVVWRLHKALSAPLPDCQKFLALFTPAEREWFVRAMERGLGPRRLHDPIEYDPKLRDKFLAARAEVDRLLTQEGQRRLAEAPTSAFGVAPRSGSGLNGGPFNYANKLKQLLYRRYAIVWLTPTEIYERMKELS